MADPATPPSLPQPERRLFKKRYVLFLLVAAFLTWQTVQRASVRSALKQARAAGQPTTPAELDQFYAEVPETNNLAIAFLTAEAALTVRTNRNRSSDPLKYPGADDAPLARPFPPDRLEYCRKLVGSNAAVWIALLDAEGRTRSRYPIDLTGGFSTELPHLLGLKRLAKASALRAIVAAEEGHAAECTTAIIDIFRASRSLSEEPIGTSMLVAGGLDKLGAMVVRDCAQRVRFDDIQLVRIESEIQSIRVPDRTRRAFMGERVFGQAAFSQLRVPEDSTGDPDAPSLESVIHGLRILNSSGLAPNDNVFYLRVMAELIEAAGQPFPQSLDAAERVEKELHEAVSGATRVLHVFSYMFLTSVDNLISHAAAGEAHRRMTLTVLAIERFRLRNNNQPPLALSELVPAFLPEVPSDPFDGQPLRYQRNIEGYRLYSIGRDRVDQGGKYVPRRQRRTDQLATDLVLEVTR